MNKENKYLEEYKDNFNYYNLITKINPNYRLYFNKKTKLFEIINIANFGEICLKFSSFSLKLLEILQKSSVCNSKIIFKKIENHNSNLTEKLQEDSTNLTLEKAKDTIKTLHTNYFN